jgi:hypothetical protein
MVLERLATIVVRGAVELIKVGAWGTVSQYTHEKFRQSSGHFAKEVERGVEHQAIKLKVIKRD